MPSTISPSHPGDLSEAIEHALGAGNFHAAGNNGVIFRVPAAPLASFVEPPAPAGAAVADDILALKVLRPVAHSSVEHEFAVHSAAFETVAAANVGAPLARVPRPLLRHHVGTLSPSTLSQLAAAGIANVNSMDVILMEFIPGRDVATWFFEFILERLGYSLEDIAATPFHVLHQQVSDHLGFTVPSGKQRDADERAHAQRRAAAANMEKVMARLRREGFAFVSDELDQIARTVRLLNANGIVHHDLHERNVMCHEGRAFVVDFGSASCPGHPSPISDPHAAVADFGLVTGLRALATSRTAEQDRDAGDYLAQLMGLRDRLRERDRWQARYAELADMRGGALREQLDRELALVQSQGVQERALDEVLILALTLQEDAALPSARRAAAFDFLKTQFTGAPGPSIRLPAFLARRMQLAALAMKARMIRPEAVAGEVAETEVPQAEAAPPAMTYSAETLNSLAYAAMRELPGPDRMRAIVAYEVTCELQVLPSLDLTLEKASKRRRTMFAKLAATGVLGKLCGWLTAEEFKQLVTEGMKEIYDKHSELELYGEPPITPPLAPPPHAGTEILREFGTGREFTLTLVPESGVGRSGLTAAATKVEHPAGDLEGA